MIINNLKAFNFLTSHNRLKLIFLLFLMTISILFDVISVGSLLPLIAFIVDKDLNISFLNIMVNIELFIYKNVLIFMFLMLIQSCVEMFFMN